VLACNWQLLFAGTVLNEYNNNNNIIIIIMGARGSVDG
jgi:hypothetical protein